MWIFFFHFSFSFFTSRTWPTRHHYKTFIIMVHTRHGGIVWYGKYILQLPFFHLFFANRAVYTFQSRKTADCACIYRSFYFSYYTDIICCIGWYANSRFFLISLYANIVYTNIILYTIVIMMYISRLHNCCVFEYNGHIITFRGAVWGSTHTHTRWICIITT